MTVIKGNGFVLRPWKKGDENIIHKYGNDEEIARNLGHRFPSPYTKKDAIKWVNMNLKRSKDHEHFAIEIDDEPIGGIGVDFNIKDKPHVATFGYWLARKHWGKGLMTAIVKKFVKYVFQTHRVKRLEAAVYVWNHGSARVLEKNGFKREGTFIKGAINKKGDYIDEHIYAKINPRDILVKP